MTALTTNVLYSQSWVLFRDWLKENLTDPSTKTTDSSRKWIYNMMPDTLNRNFAGFPFIVAGDTSIEDGVNSFGVGKQGMTFMFPVTIYTRKSENKYDANQLDTLSNELRYKLKRDTTLQSNGLKNPIINDSPKDEVVLNNEKILTRSFGISFQNVMDIS